MRTVQQEDAESYALMAVSRVSMLKATPSQNMHVETQHDAMMEAQQEEAESYNIDGGFTDIEACMKSTS